MNIQGPKRNNSARERQMARKRRKQAARENQRDRARNRPSSQGRLPLLLQDIGWYVRQGGWLVRSGMIIAGVVLVVFFMTFAFSSRLYPNVTVMNVDIGRMTPEQATATLQQAWVEEIEIDLVVDGEVVDAMRPAEMGLQFDAAATVAQAEELSFRIGLVETPILPEVTLTDSGYLAMQDYLLNLADTVNIAPFNPGFEWEGDILVGVPGRPGRLLDIAPTLAALQESPAGILELGQFNIFTTPVQPEAQDPTPYLETAQAYTQQPFTLTGYDPFRDEVVSWSTDRETLTSWIEVSDGGLSLRETVFAPFVQAQTNSLNADGTNNRFINAEETINRVRDAIATGESTVDLRIRYRPHQYVIEAGDTANKIARKTGIPFYLIQQQNPGRDLNVLSIGDTLSMPTRDVTMPNEPVQDKRIVVDLEQQELWAFENDTLVFNWDISSGRSNAPTSPGIYQILSHAETASGSSFTLCDDIGCGQWEMYWFMGVYEVTPGLMNGFHGAVLLPNGAYLNGGATGYPSTFGCVMSHNDDAQALYDWAEVGTVVEIISSEFDPVSELARRTQEPQLARHDVDRRFAIS